MKKTYFIIIIIIYYYQHHHHALNNQNDVSLYFDRVCVCSVVFDLLFVFFRLKDGFVCVWGRGVVVVCFCVFSVNWLFCLFWFLSIVVAVVLFICCLFICCWVICFVFICLFVCLFWFLSIVVAVVLFICCFVVCLFVVGFFVLFLFVCCCGGWCFLCVVIGVGGDLGFCGVFCCCL